MKLTALEMNTGSFSVSPSGKQIAFTGSVGKPVKSYTQPDLWVLDIAPNAQPRNLTAGFDYDVGGGVGGDNAPPRGGGGGAPIWTSDGRSIIETYAKEGKANLGMFDVANGKETDVTSGNQAVGNFRSAPDGSQLVFTISTPTRIGDLFWLDRPGAAPKQLTHINDELFSHLNLTSPKRSGTRVSTARRYRHGCRSRLTSTRKRSIR